MVRRFGETKPNTILGVSSFRDPGLPDYVTTPGGPGGTTHAQASGRSCSEMNEAISHCAQNTDLPESVTSIRDKEITHLSPSLPHSALSSPSR